MPQISFFKFRFKQGKDKIKCRLLKVTPITTLQLFINGSNVTDEAEIIKEPLISDPGCFNITLNLPMKDIRNGSNATCCYSSSNVGNNCKSLVLIHGKFRFISSSFLALLHAIVMNNYRL